MPFLSPPHLFFAISHRHFLILIIVAANRISQMGYKCIDNGRTRIKYLVHRTDEEWRNRKNNKNNPEVFLISLSSSGDFFFSSLPFPVPKIFLCFTLSCDLFLQSWVVWSTKSGFGWRFRFPFVLGAKHNNSGSCLTMRVN